MDIFNNECRKIRCISNDGDVIDGRYSNLLTVGELYTIDYMDVCSFVTYVYLKEFPNKHFNSVLFEEVEE